MANATRVSDQARGYFVGTYAGTTAAQNIHIGFKPSFIFATNRTDGDTNWIWSSDVVTTVMKIAGTPATSCSAITQIDNGTVIGFSLPACDTVVNENGKTYVFLALP
jgi:hypothetical protein